jgi:hypothetical protein
MFSAETYASFFRKEGYFSLTVEDNCKRFEVLTVVTVMISVSWDVMPRSIGSLQTFSRDPAASVFRVEE